MAIFAGSVVPYVVALYLARSQPTAGDIDRKKAMLPPHSNAGIMSRRAHIVDPPVRKPA